MREASTHPGVAEQAKERDSIDMSGRPCVLARRERERERESERESVCVCVRDVSLCVVTAVHKCSET